MNIVLLDIDGVLNRTEEGFLELSTEHVRRLNRLAEMGNASVVISSTWRRLGLMSCREKLRVAGCTARIIDRTPILDERRGKVYTAPTREAEIQAWLDEHGHRVERFVILDDEHFDMGALTPRLVQTDPKLGLTDTDVERALEILRGEQNHE